MTGWNELKSGTPGYPLYEGRTGFPGSRILDGWPWIMKQFKEAGFVTTRHLGDSSTILPFAMRLKGLKTSPFDHMISVRIFTIARIRKTVMLGFIGPKLC